MKNDSRDIEAFDNLIKRHSELLAEHNALQYEVLKLKEELTKLSQPIEEPKELDHSNTLLTYDELKLRISRIAGGI